MNIPITLTRDELLDRLAKLRVKAEKVDATNLEKHRRAEQAYLRDFHKACRAALRWDYETAKENGFYPRAKGPGRNYAPSCPISQVAVIDEVAGIIKASTQARFTLSNRGIYRDIYKLLTADVPKPKRVC